MKFAVVLGVLAVAVSIEANALSWGAHYAPSLTYTAVSGPAVHGAWGHGAWAAPGAWAGPSAWAARSAWAAPGAWAGHGAWTGAPAAVDVGHGAWGRGVWGSGAWTAPAAVAVAPAAVATHAAIAPAAYGWGHEGSYVAKTRGATHIAPLAGHAHSAAAINVHPAPGTV